MGGKQKSGGGARKLGHNRAQPSNIAYKAEMRWERNKRRRLKRHIKAFPDDTQAAKLILEE